MVTEERFVIWSNYHRAWWLPDHCGYTDDLSLAGIYEVDDARQIESCRDPMPDGCKGDLAIKLSDSIAKTIDDARHVNDRMDLAKFILLGERDAQNARDRAKETPDAAA